MLEYAGTMPYTGDPVPTSPSGGNVAVGDWISTLIAAGAGIYNTVQNRKNVKDTNRANRELAEYQYSKDLEMWERMNQYNAPKSQMERYAAAGLNPNLAYGGGGSAAGNANSMPQYNAPRQDFTGMNILQGIPEMIGMYQRFQMGQAQIDNVQAQTRNTEAKTATEGFKAALTDITGQRSKFASNYDESKYSYNMGILGNQAQASNYMKEQSHADLMKSLQELRNLSAEEQTKYLNQQLLRKNITGQQITNEKNEAELLFNRYRNAWMEAGITTSDSPFLRILTRMFNSSGINMGDLIGTGKYIAEGWND